MWRYLAILLFPLILSAQSTPTGRDIDLGKGPDHVDAGIPNSYAVIIGISEYQNLDKSQNLEFPESDAAAMHRVLTSREGGAFPDDHVQLLTGPKATIANIREALEVWLPSVAKPDDRVIVYFAGHGLVKNGRGYLASWDVNPANLEKTSYPMASLGDVMANRVKARWKVLLTDACHSGKINPETSNERLDAEMGNLKGDFLTFTATTERQRSYEDPKLATGFGLFTYYLVQAWSGYADGYITRACDGRITAEELIRYVGSEVSDYAGSRGVSQTPTARGDFDPEMLLGVTGRCEKPPDRKVGTAKVTVNMDSVRIYVDGKLQEGTLSKGDTLTLPGLTPGPHLFEAVRDGYEPDRQTIEIYPDTVVAVTFRIRYPKEIKKAAIELDRKGHDLLSSHQSALSPFASLRSQDQRDLEKARDLFKSALQEDAKYSTAAFHLGLVSQLLSDRVGSITAYKQALAIDPNYVDAHINYAGLLIEDGDADEAIRHLRAALRLDDSSDQAYSFMARANLDKGNWDLCVTNANRAIQMNPSNHQAFLWKADALRQQGAEEKNQKKQTELYGAARENYLKFLSMTNFDSTPALEWVAFHFIGFGLGGRRHVDRQASFDALRVAGFLGVCLSEQKLGDLIHGRAYCERAIRQDPNDPIAYFVYANISRDLYIRDHRCEYLRAAHDSYARMIKLNKDLDESRNSVASMEEMRILLREICH